MPNISVNVTNKRAVLESDKIITCGNSDYTLTFAFDDEWAAYNSKTARFAFYKNGETKHIDQIFTGDTVAVPVLSGITQVMVGVFAGDLHTTTPARIFCEPSILCYEGAPEDPPEDVYNQIMHLLNVLEVGTVSDERVAEAVENYMAENPVTTGTAASEISYNNAESVLEANTVQEAIDALSTQNGNCLPEYSEADNGKVLGIVDGSPAWVEATVSGGDSGETETPEVTTHGIVWDLVNITSSNPVASVSDGESLSAVLTAADGYTLGDVTITMGGEVVTGVWDADTATVTIASVTGDVMISCAGVAENTGEAMDTSPVIEQENVGVKTTTGAIAAYTGLCIARYSYEPNIDEMKESSYYDSTNDYMTTNRSLGGFVYYTPHTKFIEAGCNASVGNTNKIALYQDTTKAQIASNASMNITDPTAPVEKEMYIARQSTLAMYANNVVFTLSMYDLDDSYAYWTDSDGVGILPIGVKNGDILFAGKNTPYYGMTNINEAASSELSYDDDVAQDYSIATTSILGEELANDPNYEYGLSADFAAIIDEVKTAWMMEYGGDYRKIPIIISTDQHGRTNAGIFTMLGKTLSMHDVSKIMNLGDTVSTDWYDADTEHPLLSNAQLESWCESVKAIPFSKQLNVFGNHDCCYGNYADEGNAIGTRYPDSKAHLYQYFRNIYARRTNNHGWLSVKDDAFNVKYVVYSLYQWPNGLENGNAIHTEQLEWFVNELKADDGYDIVIVAHEPFNLNCTTANYPTDGTLQDVTWARGIALEAVINARMNKTSGMTTDADGASHTFDFSGCTSELLCSLHGHTHEDQYAYTEGGMLQNAFDWFANNTFFFALIDRVNRVLNVWKIEAPDGVPAYVNYQISLDKPTE